MNVIGIDEIEGFRIGSAEDAEGGSGCTVVICDKGAVGGVDVRGGGPATRETDLLDPLSLCSEVYGILLSGGSAFGLNAAGGVMKYLEERGIGFDGGIARIPIVPAACLFDLIAETLYAGLIWIWGTGHALIRRSTASERAITEPERELP